MKPPCGNCCPALCRIFLHPHCSGPQPRVAVVGEILLTYHADANNHIVEQIRQEGGEPLLPDFANFMLYCLRDAGTTGGIRAGAPGLRWAMPL